MYIMCTNIYATHSLKDYAMLIELPDGGSMSSERKKNGITYAFDPSEVYSVEAKGSPSPTQAKEITIHIAGRKKPIVISDEVQAILQVLGQPMIEIEEGHYINARRVLAVVQPGRSEPVEFSMDAGHESISYKITHKGAAELISLINEQQAASQPGITGYASRFTSKAAR
jgi:hypothetical protein